MKIAFSTLGCPGWSWKDIFATAKDLGYDGIEIRGVGKEMYAPAISAFSVQKIEKTREKLKEAGLTIPILSSGASVGLPDEHDNAKAEIMEYIKTAKALETPFIRVFFSSNPAPTSVENLEYAQGFYGEMCKVAADSGVRLLLETAGQGCDTKRLAQFMQQVPQEGSGLLWDLHHPYRFGGESPEQTYQNIGKYVHYMHVKDSVMEKGQVKYCMMGYGDVPVQEALSILQSHGYDGFISLEWLKRWCPDLQEPGIVFSQFISYIKRFI